MAIRSHAMWLALAAWCVLCCAVSVRADVISVGWVPVEHPEIGGYRLVLTSAGAEPVSVDFGLDENEWTVTDLPGDCRVYCVTVYSLDLEGVPSNRGSTLCGYADPEVRDVGLGPSGWTLVGDNLAEDAAVYLDDDDEPVQTTRDGCGSIRLPRPPRHTVVVRNPSDGVGTRWELPFVDYLEQSSLEGAVTLTCAMDVSSGSPTVTRVSHTPGLVLNVEGDLPGIGTECAAAVAAAIDATGDSEPWILPKGDGTGVVYVFLAN